MYFRSSPSVSQREARKRPFYGWYVVAAASFHGMFGNGVVSSGFSIFFQSIRSDLNVSYTAMAFVFSLSRAEGGLGGPLVGWLVDRYGARRMILVGGITAGIGLVFVSRATEYWQFIVLFVGVVSVGKTAGLGQTLMAVVNQWFVRRKGLALSTLMTSFAGGGAIVVPLLGLGIATIGWRATLMYAGIFIVCITIPVAKVIRSRPEDMGLGPDGDPLEAEDPADAGQEDSEAARARSDSDGYGPDFTVRQTLRTSAFWFLLLGLTVRVSATNAIIIHIFPMLEDKGFDEQQAALFVSAMFFIAIPLRFGMGVAGDYLSPRKILFVGMNGAALGLLALYLLDGIPAVVLFIIGFSLVEGITSVNWLMVGNYFGRSRFASIMGFMSLFHNAGMMVSPIFSGWIRDTTGSYDIVMLTFIPIYVIGSLAFTLARRPVHPSVSRTARRLTIAPK